jgi:hypothetical protein
MEGGQEEEEEEPGSGPRRAMRDAGEHHSHAAIATPQHRLHSEPPFKARQAGSVLGMANMGLALQATGAALYRAAQSLAVLLCQRSSDRGCLLPAAAPRA